MAGVTTKKRRWRNKELNKVMNVRLLPMKRTDGITMGRVGRRKWPDKDVLFSSTLCQHLSYRIQYIVYIVFRSTITRQKFKFPAKVVGREKDRTTTTNKTKKSLN